MKINKLIKFVAAGVLLFNTTACTENFEDYNKNPHEPDLDEMGTYLTKALLLNLQDMMMPEQENFAQYVDCLLPGGFSGYVADSNTGSGWSGRYATYNPSDDWRKIPFNDFYEKLYPNYFQLKNQCTDELYLALGELYRIATMLRVTDTYGPIPYSQVGVANGIKAPYDSQKAVYTKMLEDLDGVIDILTKYSGQDFDASADRIYNGHTASWMRFANSLKLRMAMRTCYVDGFSVNGKTSQALAEEAVAGGVMTTAKDGAFRKVADHNPWQRFMVMWSDARIAADLTCYMNAYSDPRREAYYGMSTFKAISGNKFSGSESYIGLRRGIEMQKYNAWSQGCSAMNVTESTDIIVFLASEAMFLRAEGALRGWNMGGTPEYLYKEAIRTSFEERGVDGVDAYLANTGKVENYKDPLKGQNGQAYDYSCPLSSDATVAWDESADFEQKLERVITQKWIANFPNGMESWSEYRRTGYPVLMPMAANLSPNGVVSDEEGARRMPYPVEEYTENGESVEEAVATLAQESNTKKGDTMATHVWWDCK